MEEGTLAKAARQPGSVPVFSPLPPPQLGWTQMKTGDFSKTGRISLGAKSQGRVSSSLSGCPTSTRPGTSPHP